MDRIADLAWAAGFFDGEGYVGLQDRQGRSYAQLRVSITQVDRRVLDRFAVIVGAGRVYGPYDAARYNVRSQPRYEYAAIESGAHLAINLILPWLSEVKTAQARQAIDDSRAAHVAAVGRGQDRAACKRGHLFDQKNTKVYFQGPGKKYKSRGCRACMKESVEQHRRKRLVGALLEA